MRNEKNNIYKIGGFFCVCVCVKAAKVHLKCQNVTFVYSPLNITKVWAFKNKF